MYLMTIFEPKFIISISIFPSQDFNRSVWPWDSIISTVEITSKKLLINFLSQGDLFEKL